MVITILLIISAMTCFFSIHGGLKTGELVDVPSYYFIVHFHTLNNVSKKDKSQK